MVRRVRATMCPFSNVADGPEPFRNTAYMVKSRAFRCSPCGWSAVHESGSKSDVCRGRARKEIYFLARLQSLSRVSNHKLEREALCASAVSN